jgi:hypothetical protein
MALVQNDDAADKTVNFLTQVSIDGQAVGDPAIVVTAGEQRIIGPFRPSYYNDGNGKCQITYSAVTNLKIAIFEPGPT